MRFCHSHNVVTFVIFSLIVLIYGVPPAEAVREGTANANITIKRYERAQDVGRAALWPEAAADCLEVISVPMTEILFNYHTRRGNTKLAEISQKELADVRVQ